MYEHRSWPGRLSFSFWRPRGRLIAHTSCSRDVEQESWKRVCFHSWCCEAGVCLCLCVRGKTYRLFDTNNAGLLDPVLVYVWRCNGPPPELSCVLQIPGESHYLRTKRRTHTHTYTHSTGESLRWGAASVCHWPPLFSLSMSLLTIYSLLFLLVFNIYALVMVRGHADSDCTYGYSNK